MAIIEFRVTRIHLVREDIVIFLTYFGRLFIKTRIVLGRSRQTILFVFIVYPTTLPV